MPFDPRTLTFRNPLPAGSIDRCLRAMAKPWDPDRVATVVDVSCGNGEALARLREMRLARDAADRMVAQLAEKLRPSGTLYLADGY